MSEEAILKYTELGAVTNAMCSTTVPRKGLASKVLRVLEEACATGVNHAFRLHDAVGVRYRNGVVGKDSDGDYLITWSAGQ